MSESVVGVWNLFATKAAPAEPWLGSLALVGALWPGLPIVGYEHGAGLRAATGNGFRPIGPLRIWWRSTN